MDIDFLARNISNFHEKMEKVINEICRQDMENEYINFTINVSSTNKSTLSLEVSWLRVLLFVEDTL